MEMSTGSPKKKAVPSFQIFEDENTSFQNPSMRRTMSAMPLPLTTSKLANQLSAKWKKVENPMEDLLAKLTEQQATLHRQRMRIEAENADDNSSSATDPFATGTPPTESVSSGGRPDAAEVFRLKKELALATERMSQMEFAARQRDEHMMDLTQSRNARHTIEEAIGSPFPSAQHLAFSMGQANHMGMGMLAPAQSYMPRTSPVLNVDSSFPRPSSGLGNLASSGFGSFSGYQSGHTPPMTPLEFQPFGPAAANLRRQQSHAQFGMTQAPIGTRSSRLSPTAMEFPIQGQWGAQQPQQPASYMSTTEPLNYRRLLDRNMSCNWKYIVDKIVCNNDQQASIFLQQKLKVGTHEQKFEIVQAIIDQAYPLMINRFGNFLVQRCFEHGSPEQIVAIAHAIQGNTLNLSMDAFGCHVVQKAFDCVPEEFKAIMVHELLRRIPETVIHRYACHVWQKLFELRWSDSPPQIMKYVNEALRGMWHEVALGETGSLVVQNIFENCMEEDKRPCITEVLASIDVVAHGQFGNWCIQHICEHGSIPDRTRAVDHVLRFATEYSMDQFASKVVEKCLKVGGNEFLDRYLDSICEAHPERPRMPLIDIAGDQFGNYLVQYVLTNADSQRREIVAAHIRKHMVSLRGSKYGSRVAMLCSNPAYSTRPGPPTGMPPSRSSARYGESFSGSELHRSYSGDRQFGQYNGMGRSSYGSYR